MDRRIILATLLLQLATSYAADQPNILYIMVDDMGFNDASWNNPEVQSPNLQNLADNGVILNKAYAQVACTPSRAAYMTGYYPFRIGVQNAVVREGIEDYVPLDVPFLPLRLKEAGYVSHLVGKWHLGHCRRDATPPGRGFDSFLGLYTGYNNYYTKKIQMISSQAEFDPKAPGTVTDFFLDDEVYSSPETDYTTNVFTNRTKDLIKQTKGSPFFIALHYSAPHWPLQAPQEYLDKYPDVEDTDRRAFLAMVTAMDDGVGEVVQTLKEEKVLDNTVIFFISDNGGVPYFAGSNKPFRGKKTTLYEGGTRVPAFVYSPKLLTNTPRVSEDIFHIVDSFATILEIAGLEAGNVDSRSQWDMLRYGVEGSRKSFIYNIHEDDAAIRLGRYKMIQGDPTRFEARRRRRSVNEKQLAAADAVAAAAAAASSAAAHSRTKRFSGGWSERRPDESDTDKILKAFSGLTGLKDMDAIRQKGNWTVDKIMDLLAGYTQQDMAVVLDNCPQCQLYDLEADQSETTNLIDDLPAVALYMNAVLELYKAEEVEPVLAFPFVQDPRFKATLPHDAIDNTWCE